MTVYPNAAPRTLSDAHKKMLLEESGITPEVAAERGYTTVRSRTKLLDFKKYQRRAPALQIPLHSPDGETTSAQLRPDNPRKDKKGKPLKYETPGGSKVILDVHPRILEEVRAGDGDLWITEGIKKADSLTSQGLPTIGLIGVWNWQRDGKLLPCWDHVQLDGRRVYVVFDSDVMVKESVQLALERLVAALENRGAAVLVVYLPDTPDGAKQGVDDYLAAGGTVAELKMLARRFEPQDLGRIRLSRDEKLQAAVGYLWRRWREYDWMRFIGFADDEGNWARGHTARDVMEAFNELATKSGKVDGRGVVVRVGLRKLADMSAKSLPSTTKAVRHLEADGQLEILPPEDKSKARSYRLLVPAHIFNSMKRDATSESLSGESAQGVKGLRAPTAPRLRWSSPARPRRKEFELVAGTRRVRHTGAPPPEEQKPTPYIKRLGPHRGAVVDTLEAAGGELQIEDLCEALHRKRPRDVRRRILQPLEEAGIIEYEGDVIRLAGEWLARLEEERESTGEVEQSRDQAEKHREQRERYREHLEREKRGTPKASLAAVRRTEDLRERREKEEREEEERDEAPTPPEVQALVSRILGQLDRGELDRVRMGLLSEEAMEEGLRWRHVPPAVRRMGYRVERLPEYGGAEFIFRSEVNAKPPAPPLSEDPPPLTEEPPAEDQSGHSPFCDCESCDHPEPKYARVKARRAA